MCGLVPRVAGVAIDHADPVHRLTCEAPLVLRVPRNVDNDPVAVEGFHLDGIALGIEPVGVSGGVGGGVEENFKMHDNLQKKICVSMTGGTIAARPSWDYVQQNPTRNRSA